MTDIVEKLRRYAHPNSWAHHLSPDLIAAADEIEKLRKENQGWRELWVKDVSRILEMAKENQAILTDCKQRLDQAGV